MAEAPISRFPVPDLASVPPDVREAVATIRTQTRLTDHPCTETDAACLWLAALLVQGLAAATVVPLYLLVRRDLDRVGIRHGVAATAEDGSRRALGDALVHDALEELATSLGQAPLRQSSPPARRLSPAASASAPTG